MYVLCRTTLRPKNILYIFPTGGVLCAGAAGGQIANKQTNTHTQTIF